MNTKGIAAAAVLLLLAITPNLRAAQCSNATGAGQWELTATGVIILPTGVAIPVAQTGTFTEDTAGNSEGSQTRSIGGKVANETFKATVSVKPDCTGKAKAYVYDKQSGALVRTTTINAVFVNGGLEARGIVTSIVLPDGTKLGPVLTIEYKRVSF